jgi:hypothetical protein
MFETGPFKKCPNPQCVGGETLGVLDAFGRRLTRRCTRCRHTVREALPAIDKKVIYLDQFAVSELFKIKNGKRRADGLTPFWTEAHRRVQRAFLLQQAVFPDSNVHLDETIVYKDGNELRLFHDMLGGDVTFKADHEVELHQLWEFADAFLAGSAAAPTISFDVDEVLEGTRNAWLPKLHITANMDFSHLAAGVRGNRDNVEAALADLAKRWGATKIGFDVALQAEIATLLRAHLQAFVAAQQRMINAMATGNIEALMEAALHQSNILMRALMERFGKTDEAVLRLAAFTNWSELEHLPQHRIAAHLYAAIARSMAAGRTKPPKGMMNDIRAVSTYGPYVDAMFLDKGCAELIRQLGPRIQLKARIFSLNDKQAFLEYLDEVASAATPEGRAYAQELYDVDSL